MARAGVGARDKPGHDNGGGGGDRSRADTRVRSGPRPPSRHGRVRPGHPRRTEPRRAPDGPGPARAPTVARAGVGARDKPGHDDGGGAAGARVRSVAWTVPPPSRAERSAAEPVNAPRPAPSFSAASRWPGPAIPSHGPAHRLAAGLRACDSVRHASGGLPHEGRSAQSWALGSLRSPTSRDGAAGRRPVGRRRDRGRRVHGPVGRPAPRRGGRLRRGARRRRDRLRRLGTQRRPRQCRPVGHARSAAGGAGRGAWPAPARSPRPRAAGRVRPRGAPPHRLRGRTGRDAALRGRTQGTRRGRRTGAAVAGAWRPGRAAGRRRDGPPCRHRRLCGCPARPEGRHGPAARLCAGPRHGGARRRRPGVHPQPRGGGGGRGESLAPPHRGRQRHRPACDRGDQRLYGRRRSGRLAAGAHRDRPPALFQPRHGTARRQPAVLDPARTPGRLGHARGPELLPLRPAGPPRSSAASERSAALGGRCTATGAAGR